MSMTVCNQFIGTRFSCFLAPEIFRAFTVKSAVNKNCRSNHISSQIINKAPGFSNSHILGTLTTKGLFRK